MIRGTTTATTGMTRGTMAVTAGMAVRTIITPTMPTIIPDPQAAVGCAVQFLQPLHARAEFPPEELCRVLVDMGLRQQVAHQCVEDLQFEEAHLSAATLRAPTAAVLTLLPAQALLEFPVRQHRPVPLAPPHCIRALQGRRAAIPAQPVHRVAIPARPLPADTRRILPIRPLLVRHLPAHIPAAHITGLLLHLLPTAARTAALIAAAPARHPEVTLPGVPIAVRPEAILPAVPTAVHRTVTAIPGAPIAALPTAAPRTVIREVPTAAAPTAHITADINI